MNPLLTLEQAKQQLGVPVSITDNDTEIALKVAQVSDALMRFLKEAGPADPDWTSETVPGDVQLAAQTLLTHYYENRGADMRADEAVWATVDRLCKRWRHPAIA